MSFGPLNLAWANVMPLVYRLGRGEGLLLAVNLSLSLVSQPTPLQLLAQGFVSAAVLILLYFVNDLYDCERDLHDEGKNHSFVRFLVRYRTRLTWLVTLESLAVLALAYFALGLRSAVAVAAVFGVNAAYSALFKGRAVLDVPWVALWGALYAMVPGVDLPLTVFAMVGAMTSIAHVFQITRDRDVDAHNAIQTSAVARAWLPTLELGLACVAMAWLIGAHLGLLAGLTALTPLVLYLAIDSNQIAWLSAKLYYGVIWLIVLGTLYGA